MPSACDNKELDCLINSVRGMGIKDKRHIFSIMREGATKNDLLLWLGVPLEQVCLALLLTETRP
jgi:hypothetical protein